MSLHELCNNVNELLSLHIESFFGNGDTTFKEMIKYVLKGGKRIRPAISLDIYNSLCAKNGFSNNVFSTSFLATEYIHTSSLIIDDLPCMDNALTRRGNICIHKRYGEAMAQLTSAVLMSMCIHAYSSDLERVVNSGETSKTIASEITVYLVNRLSTIVHVTSQGQIIESIIDSSSERADSERAHSERAHSERAHSERAHSERAHSERAHNDSERADIGELLKYASEKVTVEEIIQKKTGTFFEMCFELAWILGNRSLDGIHQIREVSIPLAMAFQIIDDIHDMTEDLQTDKKNVNGSYALKYGKDKAIHDAHTYLDTFVDRLDKIGLSSPFFESLTMSLRSKLQL
ncbi:hypothetical protein EB118_08770 [bacterium]|nr:hypothetical protein [bacterium]NDC94667.1 hypothetical protein [bacterium]NDD84310.1 hypothetical protein [bacterium]NDG30155.1 hypothetical protein [bacterium]